MTRITMSVLAITIAACSSGGTGDAVFGTSPVASMPSTACNAQLDVYAAPDPITRGTASIKLVVTDSATGSPRDGLAIAIVPWMPAMGHGASTLPSVTAQGGGVYIARDVVLIMPGTWQLRAALSGACNDDVVLPIDVQ